MPSGEKVTLSFKAEAQADINGNEVVNRAYVSFKNPLPNTSNPVEASNVVWINSPDLVPTKTSNQTVHAVGDTITYDIDITNEQVGSLARNTRIIDEFQTKGIKIDHTSIVLSDTHGNIVTDKCAINQNTQTDTIEIQTPFTLVNPGFYSVYDGSLLLQNQENPLGIKTETLLHLEFKAQVVDAALAGKEVVNTVVVDSDEGPGGKDEDNAPIKGPALHIDKKVRNTRALIGEKLTYELEVTQTRSSCKAEKVCIEDAIDESCAQFDQSSVRVFDEKQTDITEICTVSFDAGNMSIQTHRDLDDTQKISVTYDVELISMPVDGLDNVATAQADNAPLVIDKERVNPSAGAATVSVVKSADPADGSKVFAGQEILYTLTVSNTGTIAAQNIAVHDRIPSGTSFVESEPVHGATYHESIPSLAWNIANLAPGEIVELKFKVKADSTIPHKSQIENHATFAPDAPGIPTDDLPILTNPVIHDLEPARIDVMKTANPESGSKVTKGQDITYTLTVSNQGGSSAQDIAVHDYIPGNTGFVSLEDKHGGSYDEDSNSIGWNIAVLHPGEHAFLTFKVQVNDSVSENSDIENYATYAPDTPGIPKRALETPSNMVYHEAQASDPDSDPGPAPQDRPDKDGLFDKTGNALGNAPWIILGILGILALAGIGYGIIHPQHRRRILKRKLIEKISKQ